MAGDADLCARGAGCPYVVAVEGLVPEGLRHFGPLEALVYSLDEDGGLAWAVRPVAELAADLEADRRPRVAAAVLGAPAGQRVVVALAPCCDRGRGRLRGAGGGAVVTGGAAENGPHARFHDCWRYTTRYGVVQHHEEERSMASVFDVAAFILRAQGPMTAMKLQKLVYYSQAWSLVWDEAPLFPQKIKAWRNGPVCPELYHEHKGLFEVRAESMTKGDPDALTASQQETVRSVLRSYGSKSSQWLSDLTHGEAPWRDARGNTPDGDASSAEITPAAMAEYYGSLDEQTALSLG